jgi:hypothetical protein
MNDNISIEFRQFYLDMINYSKSISIDTYIFEYISDIIGVHIEYILDINNNKLMDYYKSHSILNLTQFDNYTFKKIHNCNISINNLAIDRTLDFERVFLFNEIIKIGVPMYRSEDNTLHIELNMRDAYMSLLVDFINYFDINKKNIRTLIQNY